MKSTAFAAAAALAIALSGCATIVKGTTQTVAISTPPVEGANCVLSSSQGSWTVTSPGVAKVARSKEDIQIRCNKPGYQEAAATIPSSFEGWTFGNVIFGAFGIVTAGVDAATGAVNEYPHVFQVPMFPAGSAGAPSGTQPFSGKPTS